MSTIEKLQFQCNPQQRAKFEEIKSLRQNLNYLKKVFMLDAISCNTMY